LVIVDYQAGGSSNNMIRQYVNNPKGFAFTRVQSMKYSKSFKRKFKDSIHYVSSSIISKNSNFFKESPQKILTLIALIPGLLLTIYIKNKYNKEKGKKLTEL
jgi:hypothetical protein